MGLYRKGKTIIIIKLHMADLVICSQSTEGKTPSYSRRNMVLAHEHDVGSPPCDFLRQIKTPTKMLTAAIHGTKFMNTV